MARKYRDLEERLLTNSEPRPDGCWDWVAGFNGGRCNEYPRINVRMNGRAKKHYAHRLAYVVFKGPIPDGMTVDHVCCNTRCINPDHLQLETNHRNAQLSHERRAI